MNPSDDTVPFVRATDIKDGEIKTANLLHIARKQGPSIEKCRLSPGELILVRSGVNTGDCAVVPEYLAGAYAAYDLIIRFNEEIVPSFGATFLDTVVGRSQLNILKGRAAQPHINADEFRSLEIPLPPLDTQRSFVAHMQAARAERRRKLAEADALLSTMDGWLLEKLGIEMLPIPYRPAFATRAKDLLERGRLNADYFHPERLLTLRSIVEQTAHLVSAPLSEIALFIRDKSNMPIDRYIGLAHVQSHTGELVDANEDVEGDCLLFQQNDVLFARLRPYLNKVYCAEFAGSCSPEFHIIRIRDTHYVMADYLATILRSRIILSQTKHMMTGNTHPRLTNDDIVNLVVPIPDPNTQQEIVAEVQRRREEARRLRADAESSWQQAKVWFETQLLGGASAAEFPPLE